MESYNVRKKERELFRKLILDQLSKGWSYIPLIGSGASAASGIPMGIEFNNYLNFTLYKCLSNDGFKAAAEDSSDSVQQAVQSRVDLRSHGWPEIHLDRNLPLAEFMLALITLTYLRKSSGLVTWQDTALNDVIPWDSVYAIERYFSKNGNYKEVESQIDKIDLRGKKLIKIVYSYGDYLDYEKERLRSNEPAPFIKDILNLWSNWTLTLDFLCHLEVSQYGKVYLGPFRQQVMDSFNRSITYKKKPNFTHTMLAHLSQPMKIKTILTTNFDTLIEETFENLHTPLEVFDISRSGRLPTRKQLIFAPSIVKLHGSRHETRADRSLFLDPSREDENEFAKYFECNCDTGNPKHLLVLGFSGADLRIINLIRRAIAENADSPQNRFKIFWIFFSDSDLERLKMLFPGEMIHLANTVEEISSPQEFDARFPKNKKPLILCRSHYPELLLYELYQEITMSLPPGGLPFQFTHRLPAGPTIPLFACPGKETNESKKKHCVSQKRLESDAEFLADEISLHRRETQRGKRLKFSARYLQQEEESVENLPYFVLEGGKGTSSVAALAFEHLVSRFKKCIWLDLYNFTSEAQLFPAIVHYIGHSTGRHFLNTVTPISKHIEDNLAAIVDEYLRVTASNWYIFVNDREPRSAGASFTAQDKGKIDDKALKKILSKFAKLGFTLIYLKANEKKFSSSYYPKHGDHELKQEVLEWVEGAPQIEEEDTLFKDMPSAYLKCLKERLHRQVKIEKRPGSSSKSKWIDHKVYWAKLKFFYHLLLFRNPRHLSSLFTDASFHCHFSYNFSGIDNDRIKSYFVNQWIRDLESIGICRIIPGGYVWMHSSLKNKLQDELESFLYGTKYESGKEMFKADLKKRRSWIHSNISDWHFQAFRSSLHWYPLTEAIFHKLRCIQYMRDQNEWFDLRKAGLEILDLKLEDPATKDNEDKRFSPETIADFQHNWIQRAFARCVHMIAVALPHIHDQLSPEDVQYCFGDIESKRANLNQFKKFLGFDPLSNDDFNETKFTDSWKALKASFESTISKVREQTEIGTSLVESPIIDSNQIQKIRERFEHLSLTKRKPNELAEEILNYYYDLEKKQKLGFHFRKAIIEFLSIEFDADGAVNKDTIEKSKKFLWTREAISFSFRSHIIKTNRGHKIDFFKKGRRSPNHMVDIFLMNRYALSLIQSAKIDYLEYSKTKNSQHNIKANRKFIKACIACRVALDIGEVASKNAIDEVYRELAFTESLYGISLSRLGRFNEADRHYNSAIGYLNVKPPIDYEENLAIVYLRRAETSMLRHRSTTEKLFENKSYDINHVHTPSQGNKNVFNDFYEGRRLLFSWLEESWVQLEQAEYLLRARNKSVYWWGRYYFVKAWNLKECLKEVNKLKSSFLEYKGRIGMMHSKLTSAFYEAIEYGYLLQPADATRAERMRALMDDLQESLSKDRNRELDCLKFKQIYEKLTKTVNNQ